MQILSIISIISAAFFMIMNFNHSISINILNEKFASLINYSVQTINIDLALYTLIIFCLGILSVLFIFVPLHLSLKEKFNAYKRELERGSISNTSAEAKINVLENKISVLEKALDEALKKKDQ